MKLFQSQSWTAALGVRAIPKKSKGRFVSSPESSLRPVTCYILVCQSKLLTWLISGTPARGAKIKRALRTKSPRP